MDACGNNIFSDWASVDCAFLRCDPGPYFGVNVPRVRYQQRDSGNQFHSLCQCFYPSAHGDVTIRWGTGRGKLSVGRSTQIMLVFCFKSM